MSPALDAWKRYIDSVPEPDRWVLCEDLKKVLRLWGLYVDVELTAGRKVGPRPEVRRQVAASR